MQYIGIDVGKSESLFYIMDDLGKKVAGGHDDTNEAECTKLVQNHQGEEGVAVALETGNVSFMLARAMKTAGANVFVVDTYQNALIAQSTKKTDRLDAKQLANQRRH